MFNTIRMFNNVLFLIRMRFLIRMITGCSAIAIASAFHLRPIGVSSDHCDSN